MVFLQVVRSLRQLLAVWEDEFVDIENVDGKPFKVELDDITIFYTTPFVRTPGLDGYLVDIWNNHKKVSVGN